VERVAEVFKGTLVHVPFRGNFNFSAMNNQAAAAANGNVLVFMNDDVEPLAGDWLDRMLGQVQRPGVGVVGARLLYPSGGIQHAGIALGMSDLSGHPGRFLFESDLFPWLDMTRNVTAVTGACLAIRKSVFQQLGGFDTQFPSNFNDVDLCLRAREHHYSVIYEAGAVLHHRDSMTRIARGQYRERNLFYRRWFPLLRRPDPYFSSALDLKTEGIQLAFEER
jgi:GT2 family glycosyltransferase